jgi:carboxymethylenebutenolidase
MTASTAENGVFRVGPTGGAPVLLLHSWWGVTPAMHEWAQSLAEAGLRVSMPDLVAGAIATTPAEGEALLGKVDRSLVQRCADELAADGRPWAAVGFSMGAMHACRLAAREASPDQIVLFYSGTAPDTKATKTRRAQVHYVRGDDFFTDEEIEETESGLRALDVEVTSFEYPGSSHWFAERGAPGFDEAAFTLSLSRVIEGLSG